MHIHATCTNVRQYQSSRKDAESLQEELDIANMDPKEAHAKFVARVNDFKQATKEMEDKSALLKDEIARMRKTLEDLDSTTGVRTLLAGWLGLWLGWAGLGKIGLSWAGQDWVELGFGDWSQAVLD